MNNIPINIAAAVLHQGGIIAYPTESVYGFGCDPQNNSAVIELLNIKQRSVKRGLIIIASHIDQLSPYIAPLDDTLLKKVNQTWPGPTTWLLPAGEYSTFFLRGIHPLQAVRVSNHPSVIKLCNKFGGAIVSTSANITNRPAISNKIQARHQSMHQLKNQIDYVLMGETGNLKKPCEIRHGLNDSIIRTSE